MEKTLYGCLFLSTHNDLNNLYSLFAAGLDGGRELLQEAGGGGQGGQRERPAVRGHTAYHDRFVEKTWNTFNTYIDSI